MRQLEGPHNFKTSVRFTMSKHRNDQIGLMTIIYYNTVDGQSIKGVFDVVFKLCPNTNQSFSQRSDTRSLRNGINFNSFYLYFISFHLFFNQTSLLSRMTQGVIRLQVLVRTSTYSW